MIRQATVRKASADYPDRLSFRPAIGNFASDHR